MIKHEFGNQNKVRIFFNISVGFLPFLYFTKLPFSELLSQFCFIFQTFGKLFFEWGRFEYQPISFLNVDYWILTDVDRAPQNFCTSSVLNFLGLPNFLILILPEKVRKDVGFGFLRSYFFRLCLLSFSHHGSSPTTPSSFIKSTSNKNLSLFRAGPLFFFVDKIHKSFLSSHYKSFHSCQTSKHLKGRFGPVLVT